ncbi:hypothetical protein [Paenibacillus woosongensis]|uniref:hypothetical protein n=1 Tax=Paenibacillus woosongensis TaxID=307580 RepID=UPI0012D8F4E0|nr:hypothetical protein [Paenibacillus woosongensis]
MKWERKDPKGRGAAGLEGAICGRRRSKMSAEMLIQLLVLIVMLIELARHRKDS